MKRNLFGLAAAAALLMFGGHAAWAECSNATLNGPYSYTIHGRSLSADGTTTTGLVDGVGVITFDGNGGTTEKDYVVENAIEVPGGMSDTNGFHIDETGTYSVSPDCTGTLTLILGPGTTRTNSIVITKRGSAIHSVVAAAQNGGTPVLIQVYSDFESLSARQ